MKAIVCLLILLFSRTAHAETMYDSYRLWDDLYEIKVTVNEVSTSHGLRDLVRYSVYKNKRFLHPLEQDGGRFFTCKFSSHGAELPEILPI